MREQDKIVFAVSHEGQGDNVPVVVIGIPLGAWEHMKDGKTHHFDLTRVGVPVKLMLFGGVSRDQVLHELEHAAAEHSHLTVDMRGHDFGIKPKE